MTFEIKPDTLVTPIDGDISIVSGPGGSPFVTSRRQPHLGGNFDGGDLGTQYPNDLWPWLLELFHPRKMVDLGCGTGESAKWFQDRGVETIGVDGLAWNAKQAVDRNKVNCILHDLETGPLIVPGVDLIWCADVAEHIEERFVGNLLVTLRQCKVLAFCHGTEEHEKCGWHHVNNKPESYWVEKLASVGMIESPHYTKMSREIGNHGWWPISGRIYVKA